MKRLFTIILFLSVGSGLLLLSEARLFSAEEERAGADASNPTNQTRSPLPSLEGSPPGPFRLDHSFHFKAKRNRETTSAERGMEATVFHQKTLLNRFQGADSKGEILLSFSVKRVELILRSAGGREAPILGSDLDIGK